MKAILMSIQPKWCELIASGKKTIEVRKTAPKDTPFKVYIYCAKPKVFGDLIMCKSEENSKLFGYGSIVGINRGFRESEDELLFGKVIGEFICDTIDNIMPSASRYIINNDIAYTNKVARESCLYFDDLKKYLGNKVGRALHISNLKIYDKPKELGKFRKSCKRDCECENPTMCEYLEYDALCDCAFNCSCVRPCITRPPRSWNYVNELEND